MILATRNQGKVREFNALLGDVFGGPMLSLRDVPEVPNVVEDGETFEANALKKALEVSLALNTSVLADDSGLEVDALDGAPGVYSARYAGEHGDDEANNRKLVGAIARTPQNERTARYVAVLALCIAPDEEGRLLLDRLRLSHVEERPRGELPLEEPFRIDDRVVLLFRGTCEGQIITEARGDGGFGYDPYFFIPHLGKTFAEIPLELKNTMSHRAAVVRRLLQRMVLLNFTM